MRIPRTISICLGLLAAGCGSERAPHPDAVLVDPEHHRVAYENEAIRILAVTYPPGTTSPVHEHPAHCWVMLPAIGEAARMRADSTAPHLGDAGRFGCSERLVHAPANMGEAPIHLVVFEFIEGATAGVDPIDVADPLETDPIHHRLEFENGALRIVRHVFHEREIGEEHGHPAHCVVWLRPDRSEPNPPAVGAVECHDTLVHTPAHRRTAVEHLVVEFKGRAHAG